MLHQGGWHLGLVLTLRQSKEIRWKWRLTYGCNITVPTYNFKMQLIMLFLFSMLLYITVSFLVIL
jgi:hypothetical protein